MKYRARFLVTANDEDITALIASRLVRLEVQDSSDMESDTCTIVLADNDPAHPIEMPPTGAELNIYLGWGESDLQLMGEYVVDELSSEGPPTTVTIGAKAAVFDRTPTGKTPLQSVQVRSWATDTELGKLAAQVAADHGLELLISDELRGVKLRHYDQSDSDLHMLVKLSHTYDFVVKPVGGKLILVKRGKGLTASGQEIPPAQVSGKEIASHHWSYNKRKGIGVAVAQYRAKGESEHKEVKVGEGTPERRVPGTWPDEATARAKATAFHDNLLRKMTKLTLVMQGRPDIVSEGPVVVSGFQRPEVNKEWNATQVTHTVDSKGGYVTHVVCEDLLGLALEEQTAINEPTPDTASEDTATPVEMGEEPDWTGMTDQAEATS